MALTARLLATGPQKFHALQILFVRQTITAAGCFLWMWYNNVPHAPFGAREVRWLLVARGLGGFWGVFGLYYSLTYLDLADATVITFLAPIVATWACSLIPSLKEPFTKHEFFAGVTSLFGVVLIVPPGSLFFHGEEDIRVEQQGGGEEVTPHQRLVAVLVALVGVLGTASAFTTIRVIGKRAHPLISVNYFSSWCAVVSLVSLTTIPSVGGIIWPESAYQWALLGGIGVTGFVMQFCRTRGLQLEKTGRATNMVYSSMIFALFWEKMVWGTTPGWLSIMGSVLIFSSAVYVGTRQSKQNEVVRRSGDEEVGLMNCPGVEVGMMGRN
jgi:drug/metabolite transporter (DMT)-like permease